MALPAPCRSSAPGAGTGWEPAAHGMGSSSEAAKPRNVLLLGTEAWHAARVAPCPLQMWAGPHSPSRAAPGDAAMSVPSSMPQAQAMCEPRPCADSENQSENQLHEAPRSQKLLLGRVNVLRKEAELFKRHRCGTWGHGLVAECWGKVGLVELFSNPNGSILTSLTGWTHPASMSLCPSRGQGSSAKAAPCQGVCTQQGTFLGSAERDPSAEGRQRV